MGPPHVALVIIQWELNSCTNKAATTRSQTCSWTPARPHALLLGTPTAGEEILLVVVLLNLDDEAAHVAIVELLTLVV